MARHFPVVHANTRMPPQPLLIYLPEQRQTPTCSGSASPVPAEDSRGAVAEEMTAKDPAEEAADGEEAKAVAPSTAPVG